MSHARYALSDDEEDDVRAAQPSSSYASVKDEVPRAPSPLPFAAEIKEETIGEPEASIVQLAHQWLNERGAPEIQPWNAALVESVMDQIAQQQVRAEAHPVDSRLARVRRVDVGRGALSPEPRAARRGACQVADAQLPARAPRQGRCRG